MSAALLRPEDGQDGRGQGVCFPGRYRPGPRGQRGAAGIEFGLTLALFLVLCFGLVGYGSLFLVQQRLASMAAEAARTTLAAVQQRAGAGPLQAAQDVCDTVAPAGNANANWLGAVCTPRARACPWNAAGAGDNCIDIELTYDTAGWPLLSAMRAMAGLFGQGSAGFLPSQLRAAATVQISPESSP